jgi:hypothetical protein
MSRFSQITFHAPDRKDPDYDDIKVEQKALKLKDVNDRDVSVGSKVMLPNPKEEGQVVYIDGDRVIVKMAPPHRIGRASDLTCIRKCGRKPAKPKVAHPKPGKTVKFAASPSKSRGKTATNPSKSRGKTRKNKTRNSNNNNNNSDRMAFLLKALNLHNASRKASRGKTATTRKSRKSRVNED